MFCLSGSFWRLLLSFLALAVSSADVGAEGSGWSSLASLFTTDWEISISAGAEVVGIGNRLRPAEGAQYADSGIYKYNVLILITRAQAVASHSMVTTGTQLLLDLCDWCIANCTNGLDFVYDWCVKTRCIDWNMALLHELKKVLLTVLEFQSNPCSRIIQWLAGQSHYQFNNNVQINESTSTCRGLSLELEHTPEIYKVYLCSQTKIGYAYPCSLLLAPRLSHSPKAYTIQ